MEKNMDSSQSVFTQEKNNLKLNLASLDKLINESYIEPGKTNLPEVHSRIGVGSYDMFLLSLPYLQEIRSDRIQMRNCPYFGRFDILENGKPKCYYLGSRSELLDEFRILDWRSPLSRLFYEVQTEGYYDVETSEETRRVPIYHKVNIKIQNSVLLDAIVSFSKDPASFENDKVIIPAVDYRYIERKPAKKVLQKEIRREIEPKAEPIESNNQKSNRSKGSSFTDEKPRGLKPDRFLTSELQSRGDPKIHTIYRTFQSDQFRIVRLPSDHVVILNGVAGSGKTSIGYHRLAYLAFEERSNVLKPNRMLVFGPNKLFLSFVSELLPSLRIQGVTETTFEDWALQKLGLAHQDNQGTMERMILITDKSSELFLSPRTSKNKKKTLWKRSRIKGSLAFGKAIKEIVEAEGLPCPVQNDLPIPVFGKGKDIFMISKEMLLLLWQNTQNYHLLDERFNAFKDSIVNHIQTAIEEKSFLKKLVYKSFEFEKKPINDFIEEELSKSYIFYPLTIYSLIINNKILSKTISEFPHTNLDTLGSFIFDKETVDLEDLAGILYVKLLIEPNKFERYEHIMVDEGQDFSPLHYEIFNNICQNNSMTILGDIAQGIVAHRGLANWNEISGIFPDSKIENLLTSYRSTYQITNLANEIIPKVYKKHAELAIPYQRYGKKPKLLVVPNENRMNFFLEKEINSTEMKNLNTGIITKTEVDAENAYRFLESRGIKSTLVRKRDQKIKLHKGIRIIPIALSKGLEFEKVILLNVSKANYDDFVKYDGRLLYVGVTRALHELIMISIGEPSFLFKGSNCLHLQQEV